MQRLSFHDAIRKNKQQSFFLILVVLLVLLGLTYIISLIVTPEYTFTILIFGTIISFLYIIFGYYNSHRLAIASVNAKLANQPEHRQYHNIVEGLCLASGLPKPKLYVMNNPQINAFASGRNPENAVICVTTGALQKLNKHELEGVLAHELSHIANFDIRFMTIAAILVGMVSIIAQIFLRSLWFGGSGNSNNKGNTALLIIGIILAILAPLITALVQLAISRKREYGADSSAVKFMRTPTGLIGALQKIKADTSRPMKVSGAMAPLFLSNPRKEKELFMTHPPIHKRIARLKRM